MPPQQPQPKYDTSDVARSCGVVPRQAQNICRAVLGQRKRYKLTPSEFERVCGWHAEHGYETKPKEANH